MTTKKNLMLTLPLVTALTLGGCSVNNTGRTTDEYMSCTDLAREIGKYTQVKEDADVDSIVGTVGVLISDDKYDQISNGIDSISGDFTGMSARNELDKLNDAYVRSGCT